ncbi:hypothetical protein ACFRJ8_15610 [Arthrobacter sp. NPDC056886]|uniref:hypothetical protein n=1 Tax=Arthrobacter sp. NPDC056886 TaxID=3345960 RepID=UPI00366DCCE9
MNQTEIPASNRSVDDHFYEDAVFPDGENDGYFNDTSGPVDGMLPADPAADSVREARE